MRGDPAPRLLSLSLAVAMQVSSLNEVKIYSLSCGKSLPEVSRFPISRGSFVLGVRSSLCWPPGPLCPRGAPRPVCEPDREARVPPGAGPSFAGSWATLSWALVVVRGGQLGQTRGQTATLSCPCMCWCSTCSACPGLGVQRWTVRVCGWLRGGQRLPAVLDTTCPVVRAERGVLRDSGRARGR